MTGPYVVRVLGLDERPATEWVIPSKRVVSVKAFETLEEVRVHASRLLSRWRDADGMPKVWGERWTTWNRLHALACSKPENGGAFTAEGGKVELPDGSTITVEARTWRALCDATGLPYPRSDEDRARILAAWNAEHAIGGERR